MSHFRKDLADRAENFIQNYLRHTMGEFSGKPLKLLPFQRDYIRKLFGTVRDDGETRQYRTSFFSVARKNGKSTLCSAIALYLLYGDRESGAQVYSVAYSRQQASIIFNESAKMVRQNGKLYKRCRILDSTKHIAVPRYGSKFAALSADASNAQGLNPSGVLFDEIAEQRNLDLWEVMTTGSDTRRQPVFVALGTAGVNGESPLYEYLLEYTRNVQRGIFQDDSFLPCLYTMPEGADWQEESTWAAANPAMCDGGFLKIDSIREAYEKAKRFPSEEASFRRYRLNQMVQQSERWIPIEEWDANKITFDEAALKELPCFIGVDLSATRDLTAVALVWVGEDRLYTRVRYFYPDEDLPEKSEKSRIPFDIWARNGHLQLTRGRTLDYDKVSEFIRQMADTYEVREVCYDPALAAQWANKLSAEGFTLVRMVQFARNLSGACKEFEKRILDGTFHHEGDPVTRFCVDSAAIYTGPTELVSLTKPDRLKASKRIDGVSAILTALARIQNIPDFSPQRSPLILSIRSGPL